MIPVFSASISNANFDFLPSIQRVLSSHWYILGEEVNGFESEFASYIGVSDCVSLANGTDALELALRAVGVNKDDKVIAVANAGFYGSTAIHAIGAIPVYVDVDVISLNMSAASLAQALKQSPKAVILTHLYGQMANVEELVRLAHEAGVAVIEDCAQAHGAMSNGNRAGSFGDIGCFSFYPTKNLGALGDGGCIVTNNPSIASAVRRLRQYGWAKKYHVETQFGRNSRLDEIQAAVLRYKLPLLDECNSLRRKIATKYNEAFLHLPLTLPASLGEDYVAHLYVIRVDARESFRNYLKSRGVATDVHYPLPDHLQTAYLHGDVKGNLLNTEKTCSTVVTLPCFPGLSDMDVNQVITSVQSFFS